jgi:ATP-dependent helicase/nuclease subunit A
MKNLNYFESIEELKSIVAKLVNENKIDKKLLKYIDVNKIYFAINEISKLFNENTKIIKEKQFILQEHYNNLIKNSSFSEPVIIQGVIDLMLIDKNKAIVIDFKTNRNTTENELVNKYKLQLEIYAMAVKSGYEIKSINKYLYSFDLNKLIPLASTMETGDIKFS